MATDGSISDVTGDKDLNFSEAICAICDNGGELICCEGKCLRSFHATVEDGIDSACDSLELSEKIIKEGTFTCDNCQHNQHQCYVCGKLGSSDKSAGAEVFQCGACTCGYFYHPSCVANALRFMYEDEPKDIEAEIASGKLFTCPLHFCYACKQKEQEDEASVPMQFAVCRRCPIAYHRKCLPGYITFEDDDDEGIITRAWDDLIPNKILIYCMEHVINEDFQTPHRDHLKFPYTNLKKENQVKELVTGSLSKRTTSKPSESYKSEKLLEEGQAGKSSLKRRRHSGFYSLREPKRRFASKTTLQKSSSMSHRNCSVLYSFRDRSTVTKYKMGPLLSGLKKKVRKYENNSSSTTSMDAVLSNRNSSSDSEKRRKSGTEVEEHNGISDSEEKRESVEKVATTCDNESVINSKLEFQESSGSETKIKGSEKIAAECENSSLATILENQHIKQSKIIEEDVTAGTKRKSSENRQSFGSSKKRSKIIKEAAPDVPIVFALFAQRSESFEKLPVSNDCTATKLEKHVSPGSEKISRSSKEVEASDFSDSGKERERFKELAEASGASKLDNAKACGSEKRSESVVKVAGSTDSMSRKLENPKVCTSEKRSESVEKPAGGIARKLENPKACGSEKRIESIEKLSGSKDDSMARKLENPKACGSEKRIESIEKLLGSKDDSMARKLEIAKACLSKKRNESAVKVAGSKDSLSRKLENAEACGSEKRSESVEKPTSSIARKLENPKACGLEKRIESIEKLSGSKDSIARKFENAKACGWEKRNESVVKLSSSKDSMARKFENAKACGSEIRSESLVTVAGSKDSLSRKFDNPKACGLEKLSESIEKPAGSIDRKLEIPKACGSEKRIESIEKLSGSKDSMTRKLENAKACGSEKRIESAEKLAGSKHYVAGKLEIPKACGSEKGIESIEKLSGGKDYMARKVGNHVSPGSEKTSRSNKPVEACGISGSEKQRERPKEAAACHNDSVVKNTLKNQNQESCGSENKRKNSENGHSLGSSFEKKSKFIKQDSAVTGAAGKLNPKACGWDKRSSESVEKEQVNKVESSSSKKEKDGEEEKHTARTGHENKSCSSSSSMSMNLEKESKMLSNTTFKPLDFYTGPYEPLTENDSVGWLIE